MFKGLKHLSKDRELLSKGLKHKSKALEHKISRGVNNFYSRGKLFFVKDKINKNAIFFFLIYFFRIFAPQMKRFIILTIIFAFASLLKVSAEKWYSLEQPDNGYFNHIDGAFTAGTTGLGFDLAFPLKDWGRLRVGGVWRPRGHYSDTYVVHMNNPEHWGKFSALVSTFVGVKPEKYIEMEGKSSMNHFKMLVDFFPIKNHRNFHVTVGFFWGTSDFVTATNTSISSNTIAAIKTYNTLRKKALNNEDIDLSFVGINLNTKEAQEFKARLYDKLIEMGDISIPLGERTDENGETHVVSATINDKDVIEIEAKVNSFKPYIGAGYEIPITKDKRTTIGVDAGILIWGGKPKVQAFEGLSNISGQNTPGYLRSADKYPVYPEASIRISQRIW